MFFNEDYPWYLQKSPVFTALYSSIYDVAKNISPLEVWRLFYLSELDNKNVKSFAALWGLVGNAAAWTGIRDALIYNQEKWGNIQDETGKYWSGIQGGAEGGAGDWYSRYLAMKVFVQGKPFNYLMIQEALSILFGTVQYSVSIKEEPMSCEITITSDDETCSILDGIISYDPTLFGKPVGIKITFIFSRSEI